MKRKGTFARRFASDLPTKLICVTAAVILFFFHRVNTLTERFFSVPLRVDVPAGLALASQYPRSVRITLRGAEEAIYPILEEDIEADVSLKAHKNPGVYRAPVRVVKKGTAFGVEPLEVRVEPQEITFTLEPLMERRVNVVVDLRGSPAYGFELGQYSVAPQSVVIRGAKSFVQAVNALSTDEVDLSGRTASFALKVKVALPNSLLKVVGDSTLEFRAVIQETMLVKKYDSVGIEEVNLSPHLKLKSPLPPGSVRMQGPQLAIEGMKPEQVHLVADCSAVHRPGRYLVRLRPEAPSNVTVLDYAPKELDVEMVALGD
jgi:YbbR domain-containing protein